MSEKNRGSGVRCRRNVVGREGYIWVCLESEVSNPSFLCRALVTSCDFLRIFVFLDDLDD